MGHFKINSLNSRANTLNFVERNNLIENNKYHFCKTKERKWTLQSLNDETKDVVDC